MTSWAVDLKDVGAIYPFQGMEVVLVIIGLAFWIWFHVAQLRNEAKEIQHEMESDRRGERARNAIDGY
jgi:hypothetical protein